MFLNGLQLNNYEQALYYEIFNSKEYGFLDKFIKKSKIVFDVGGFIGLFSLYCLKHKKNLNIHFFEPVEDYLNKAKKILKISSNIVYNDFGLWKSNGYKNIYINDQKNMQSSLFTGTSLNTSKKCVKAKFLRLKDYLDNNSIKNIDLMKLDIEGAEFDIILDMGKSILDKIKVLCFEYHIFDSHFKMKFDKTIAKLKQLDKNIEQIVSKYSNDFGYILVY